MAAVRHLGFLKFKFFNGQRVKRPILHHRTKLCKDQSKRWGRYCIFCDFQGGGRRQLRFSKIRNFNGRSIVRGQYASSCQVSSKSVKRLQRCGDLTGFFSKWRASILDLLSAHWDHPRWLHGSIYRCAKFLWNQYGSFDYETFNIVPIRLENAYSRPKLGVLGRFHPKVINNINKNPKGTPLR